MERFHGRLRDGDRVIFEQVAGHLETPEGWTTTIGRFEVHEGGLLANDLPTDHPYSLDLDDGRTGPIRLRKDHASTSAGIARMVFRLTGELAASLLK